MKRAAAAVLLALLLAAGLAVSARAAEPSYPQPTARVVDAAGILQPATRQHLEAVCRELEEKTQAELAAALVPSIAPLDVDAYAVELFRRWGVGKDKADNGVLLVVARDERRVRIEVGYGLEGLLPDGRVGGILRSAVVPHLRRDDWDAGVRGGIEALAAVIAADHGDTLVTLSGSPYARGDWESESRPRRGRPSPLVLFAILGLFLLMGGFGSRHERRRRRGYRGLGGWGGPFFGGGFGGGGWSGGGGGGFGGFGGGSSGGGGASSGF